jgi:hypothetical protein
VAVWCGTPLSIGGELCGVLSILARKKLSELWVLYLFYVDMVEFICAFLLHTVDIHDLALFQLCYNVVHRAISTKLVIAPQSKPLLLCFTADQTCERLH